jgi:tRNA pseudouridine13 synthase
VKLKIFIRLSGMKKAMYKLKSKPEDFVVEEQIELELAEEGQYAYFWLEKRDYTTVKAVERLGDFIRVKEKDIGFAGNKDRQALTKQAISIKDPGNRMNKRTFERFNSEDITFEYIGRGKDPISLGDLTGNRFEIVVRDCDNEPAAISQFVNYFDEQRFSHSNKEIGRAIVKRDFKKACSLVDAEVVCSHYEENPNDAVGALKKLALKTRQIFVHAYQSWLWNEVVAQHLCKGDCLSVKYLHGEFCFPEDVSQMKVPIVGFGTELRDDEIGQLYSALLENEGISAHDFVIRSMPELSAEGGAREMVVEVKGLSVEKLGEKDYKLKFFLPKGCYATMCVRRMMV